MNLFNFFHAQTKQVFEKLEITENTARQDNL